MDFGDPAKPIYLLGLIFTNKLFSSEEHARQAKEKDSKRQRRDAIPAWRDLSGEALAKPEAPGLDA